MGTTDVNTLCASHRSTRKHHPTGDDLQPVLEQHLPDSESTTHRPGPPYRLYAAILLAFFAIRLGDALTDQSEWAVWVYNSRTCNIGLSVAAAVVSAISAFYLRNRTSPLLAWLLCGCVGSATTLLTNSAVGMVIGFLVGGVVVGSTATAATMLYCVCAWFTCSVFPAALLGAISGIGIALSYIHFAANSRTAEVCSIGAAAVLGIGLSFVTLRWLNPDRKWFGYAGAGLVFATTLSISIMTTHIVEAQRRAQHMPNADVQYCGVVEMVFGITDLDLTFIPTWLVGPLLAVERYSPAIHPAALRIGPDCTEDECDYATGLPALHQVEIAANSSIPETTFQKLHLRYVRSFACAAGTNLTDAAVQHLNHDHLRQVRLHGRNFSDGALSRLGRTPHLEQLSLRDANVTSRGVDDLDATSPLWKLDLSGTGVDDNVFATLAKHTSLTHVYLDRTKVTGRGLQHLKGRKLAIHLAETPFDENSLRELLLTESDFGSPPTELIELSFRGVPLSDEAVRTIGRFRTLTLLDVTGSSLSHESIRLIARLPALEWLGVDVHVASELLQALNPSTHVVVTCDAREMTIEQIRDHFVALRSARPEPSTGEFRREVDTAAATSGNISLRIKNLELSDQVVAELWWLGQMYSITLVNATDAGGKTSDYSSIAELMADFPAISVP